VKGTEHVGDLDTQDNNIKAYVMETGFAGVNWIHLSQSRLQWLGFVNTVMKLRVQ
jgi:hypothetical protein